VEADASNYATGGVLSIKCSDKKWKPVAFISKSLSDTEQNYEIHDKEMLAVVRCLETWRHFLEGAVEKFKICVTNFIRSYLHQIFDDSHGLKASLKPLRRPFDRCQSRLEEINIG